MPTRTWSGATNSNWGTSTNWVEGFVPTNADDVIFSTNVNCSITSAAVCKTIDFGTYSGTFSNTSSLTVSGNVTLGSSVTWGTFSGNLIVNTTATLTSNGKDIPGLQFSNTITVTFADDWTVTARLFFTNASITVTLNSNNIYVSGGTITHSNACTVNGTTTLNITGTVNWTAGNNYISNPIIINTTGTFTLSNNFYVSGNTITWIAGTMDVSSNTTALSGNVTFTGTGLTFGSVIALVNSTLTLSNDITILGSLLSSSTAATFTINGNTLYVGGGLDTLVNTTVSGTTNIVLNGTGIIRNTSSTGNFKNNIEINTNGIITCSNNFRYNTGVFKYTKGIVNAKNGTLLLSGTCSLIGIYKLRFKNVRCTGTITTDGFFQGSASQICSVAANTTGTNFNIQFVDGFQHIGHYVTVQDMTIINTTTNRGSLLLAYNKANKGRVIGNITYINNKPNGVINYIDFNKSLESMAGVQLQGDPAYN